MESFVRTATVDMERAIMRHTNIRLAELPERGFVAIVPSVILALFIASYAQKSFAEQPGTNTFKSPEEAIHALYLAVQSHDEQAITAILGAGTEVVSSDDKTRDKLDRDRFTEKYQQMHRLVREPDATTGLYIGAENWPFPVPLVSRNGAWQFDARAGMEEARFRQIGANELSAIQAGHELVGAGTEHGQSSSDVVKPTLVVNAGDGSRAVPFHGYYFRSLGPRKSAAAGATRQVSDNKTHGGEYAFVAYPAQYGLTGVMTYVFNQDDVVYEKDLGRNTARIAKGMNRYKPDSTWRRIE
jgi:hypothetical protein